MVLLGLAAVLSLLWLIRVQLAGQLAGDYFRQHGVESHVQIGALGLSGASARFTLGPKGAPDISADSIELYFDPLSWVPRVVEVRLVAPVVRARLDANGKVTLGSLQGWIDSLERQKGQSRFISDDLVVSLTRLRLLLAMPSGALEVDGDAKFVKNLPVLLALRARPADIHYRGSTVSLRAASLAFDQKARTLAVHFSGSAKNEGLDAQGLDVRFDAKGFKWSTDKVHLLTIPSARLHVVAASVTAGQVFTTPKLDVTVHNIVTATDGRLNADLAAIGEMGLSASPASLRTADPSLARALRQNLARLVAIFSGHIERHNGVARFTLTKPLQVTGAKGGVLRVPTLTLSGVSDRMMGALDASLSGPGLPPAKLTVRNLVWSSGGFTSDVALTAHFNFMMLNGASIAAHGAVSWLGGRYSFKPAGCASVSLVAFHPGASDVAKDVHGAICATQGPLVTGEGVNWKLSGEAQGVSADLPLANARVEKVIARVAFEGRGAPLRGLATITAGQVSDLATSTRFKTLLATGTAALEGSVWRGRFVVTDMKGAVLGAATYMHTMTSGAGSAHIDSHITFVPNHLQPADLSPLLVMLRSAEGSAAFTGDINWTGRAIASKGKLTIPGLDFMTVLGKAHALKSEINFTSLLPPTSAPGQSLTIKRIDWTIPFSAVDLGFGFSPAAIAISKANTDIAEGHATLGAINISLADPGHFAGAVQLTSIALNSLVTASNLSSKVKLEGKVSGRIPFTMGPEGFRITNGRVTADGPGRLSVDRSLWAQGDAALSSNAVQGFAYQALENLAFEQMSAELNSVPGGRLQIIFHIKGRSDPPKPQVAEVSLADILNGTALYKPIALPSGTAIDLTLDTSLNFDELLKSYTEAWSKSLSPEGQPDVAPGAKP